MLLQAINTDVNISIMNMSFHMKDNGSGHARLAGGIKWSIYIPSCPLQCGGTDYQKVTTTYYHFQTMNLEEEDPQTDRPFLLWCAILDLRVLTQLHPPTAFCAPPPAPSTWPNVIPFRRYCHSTFGQPPFELRSDNRSSVDKLLGNNCSSLVGVRKRL